MNLTPKMLLAGLVLITFCRAQAMKDVNAPSAENAVNSKEAQELLAYLANSCHKLADQYQICVETSNSYLDRKSAWRLFNYQNWYKSSMAEQDKSACRENYHKGLDIIKTIMTAHLPVNARETSTSKSLLANLDSHFSTFAKSYNKCMLTAHKALSKEEHYYGENDYIKDAQKCQENYIATVNALQDIMKTHISQTTSK